MIMYPPHDCHCSQEGIKILKCFYVNEWKVLCPTEKNTCKASETMGHRKGRDFRAAYGFYPNADLWFDMFSSHSSLLFSSSFFQNFLCLAHILFFFFWGSITFSNSLHFTTELRHTWLFYMDLAP